MMKTLAAYVRERFPPLVFVPAILGLTALAISIPDSGWAIVPVARALVLMSLLFLQFRLWDDLEDRDRDAQTHPERVLVGSAPRPFWWAMVALASINLGMVKEVGTPAALGALSALDLAARVAYSWLRGIVSERVWTQWILLTKYPAFVAIVALALGPTVWQRLLVASVGAFVIAQFYERWHNRAPKSGVPR